MKLIVVLFLMGWFALQSDCSLAQMHIVPGPMEKLKLPSDNPTLKEIRNDPTEWEGKLLTLYGIKMGPIGTSFFNRPGSTDVSIESGIPILYFATRGKSDTRHPGPWFLLSRAFREELSALVPLARDERRPEPEEPYGHITFFVHRYPKHDPRRETYGGWAWMGLIQSVQIIDVTGNTIKTFHEPDPTLLASFTKLMKNP